MGMPGSAKVLGGDITYNECNGAIFNFITNKGTFAYNETTETFQMKFQIRKSEGGPMKKLLVVMVPAIWIIIGCATEKAETIRQADMAQEKCDAPTYRVGDTWKYRTESWKFWSERVVKIEDNLVYIEYTESKHTRGLDIKTLQSKVEIDRSGIKRKIPESEYAHPMIEVREGAAKKSEDFVFSGLKFTLQHVTLGLGPFD